MKVLRKLYGPYYNGVSDVQEMIKEKQKYKQEGKGRWSQLFGSQENRRGLLISIGILFFTNTSGVYVIVFYASHIFELSGSKLDQDIAAIFLSVSMFITTIVSLFFVDWVGRRRLLIFSTAGMTVSSTFLGIYFYYEWCCLETYNLSIVSVISCCIYGAFFSIGLGPVTNVIVSEIFENNIRHIAVGFCNSIGFFLMFLVTLSFHQVLETFHVVVAFGWFSISSIMAFVFVIFVMPDTKGKSFKEIQDMLAGEPNIIKHFGSGNSIQDAIERNILPDDLSSNHF